MRLKAGEYCSGAEYAAYYKEIFKAMYPTGFGSEKGWEKGVDGIKSDDDQTTIDEPDCIKCGDTPCSCLEDMKQEEPQPEKKKRGRPKGSKGKGRSK